MMTLVLLLLLISAEASTACNKTSWDIIKHLNLTENKNKFALARPVNSPNGATEIKLGVLLYAILEVQEKEQKFVSYVWVDLMWTDPMISWDPKDFCGRKRVSLPHEFLWHPDITIAERTEKDKATESPYLVIKSYGGILTRNDMVLVTTCTMEVYQFPFDVQSCDLTFRSIIHDDSEIKLTEYANQNSTTAWSNEIMRSQSDWVFINIESFNRTEVNFEIPQSEIIYRINMKRRSILYVVNFLLPVLMFLGLDLASFMISDSGGEKLGFKVTVLLAVTVMQLILNEILPSSSDRIPLIALFCIGIFALMMLSLLETILVMYLIEKDSKTKDGDEGKEDKQCNVSWRNCVRDVSKCLHPGVSDETPSEVLSVVNQASSSSKLTEDSPDFEKEVLKALALLLSSRKEEEEPSYWTRVTKTINKVFFTLYVITVSVFLVYMFYCWVEDMKKRVPKA